jgi:hypothetical protein
MFRHVVIRTPLPAVFVLRLCRQGFDSLPAKQNEARHSTYSETTNL